MERYYELRGTPHDRAYRLWNDARQRARRSDLPFEITLDWLKAKIDAGTCEVTGINFDTALGPGSGRGNPFGPSLDQKVPGAGYTPDNTRVVCWMFNLAKGTNTDADVMKLAKALVQREAALDHQRHQC